MHQKTFPTVIHTTIVAFELLHLDVWGLASCVSLDGCKYFLSIVDDYTRFTWIFPLTVKSEVCAMVLNFVKSVERQFNVQLKAIQCDNGGEFVPVCNVLRFSGVQIRHSCSYTHQQNGLVERKHQHITELGLAMLSKSKLSMNFWWHAFSTAVHLINVLPTPVLQGSTPCQQLFHKQPDYMSLRVFGCACYPFLRPYNTSKFQLRSSKCIFVGYNSTHKGYLCLHSSGKCYVSDTL